MPKQNHAKLNGFAEVVRAYRERHKLSRAAASRKLSIPLRTLEDWEAGRRVPRSFMLELLTQRFNR